MLLLQVQTILAQNTTDSNSHKTFGNLKADFEDWEEVRTAPSGKPLLVRHHLNRNGRIEAAWGHNLHGGGRIFAKDEGIPFPAPFSI